MDKVASQTLDVAGVSVKKGAPVSDVSNGRYVYGIADSGVALSLGNIGIENSQVYTIPHMGLCVIVHDCPPEPYKSDDKEMVKGWLRIHQRVVDTAMEKFGTVLPMSFDIIIKNQDSADPERLVKDWLEDNFDNLKEKINSIRGKQEFGVQIFYDPKVMAEVIARKSGQVQRLKQEMAVQKPGTAYLYKHRIEKAVREELEKQAPGYFRDFYEAIKSHVEDIKVEKARRDKDRIMLMNLSCLVLKGKVEALGDELEKINNIDGFSVRFSGPWAPYSFV